MIDDINQLIKDHLPSIKDDQFARLCFEVFLGNEKGKLLMAHMFELYVNRPFTNLLSAEPEIDAQKILARAIQRDLVQSLLLRAQQYESALKQS